MKSRLTIWTRRSIVLAIAASGMGAISSVAAPSFLAAPDSSLSQALPVSSSATGLRTLKKSTDVKALEARLEKVVSVVSPSVVAVGAGGSGVVVTEDGYVLCVAHVGLRAGRKMTFTFPDGRRASGVTLGNCKDVDAALMKITDPGPWPHVDMGNSAELFPGQWCVAMSYPTTFEHGKPPVVRAGRVLRSETFSIVTDCTIMGGDSGGPLFDLNGKVIGISSTCNDSLLENRHVPVDRYRDDWDRLAKGEDFFGRPDLSALLGLRPDPQSKEARLGSVAPGSPADAAGLKAGDLILHFDGQPVQAYDELRPLAGRHHPGCTCDIVVEVRRGEQALELHTTFAKTGHTPPETPILPENEKNGVSTREALSKAALRGLAATVRILSGGKAVALGTVVDSKGYIVSKASLLQGTLVCRLHDGRELPAKLIGQDTINDLALMHVDGDRLSAANWRKGAAPLPGSIVAALGATDDSVAMGVVSTDLRKIHGSIFPLVRQGWLGVALGEDETGVVVESIVHESPAEQSGLKPGDHINAIDGGAMHSTEEVGETIRNGGPGIAVKLSVQREDGVRQLAVTLGRQPQTPGRPPEDNWGGGPFSERRWGFPSVLPHDVAVLPEDCGGPLVDSDGKVVGINIARALRVSTFALPADTVRRVVRDLIEAGAKTTLPAAED